MRQRRPWISQFAESHSPGLADPDNPDPLLWDFDLVVGSSAIDAGMTVPLFEGFAGTDRSSSSTFAPGADEYGSGP